MVPLEALRALTPEHDSCVVIFWEARRPGPRLRAVGSRGQDCQRGQWGRSHCGRKHQEIGKEADLGQRANLAPGNVRYLLNPAKARTDCGFGLCKASHTVQPGQFSKTCATHPPKSAQLHFSAADMLPTPRSLNPTVRRGRQVLAIAFPAGPTQAIDFYSMSANPPSNL